MAEEVVHGVLTFLETLVSDKNKETEVIHMSNTFEHKEMSKESKIEADSIRQKADELLSILNKSVPTEERSDASRYMNIARTNLEQSIMWAIKAVSRK